LTVEVLEGGLFIASIDSTIEATSDMNFPEQMDVGKLILLPIGGVDASKLLKDYAASSFKAKWTLIQVGYDVPSQRKKRSCIR
jgi:hypothetical protein